MLRFTTIALALTGLTAAGPAPRQPTPTSLPPQTGSADPATVDAQKDSETQDSNRKAADSEPDRVSRRLFGLGQAAKSWTSAWA